ncbi:tyrosine-type recombinase/integrase [Gemmatimonadota bacterium]
MPTKRRDTYYIDMRFKGLGRVHKSLSTRNRKRAAALESMLATLHHRGRLDLLRAFSDGSVTIQELSNAYETDQIAGLTRTLGRKDLRLSDAMDRALKAKKPDVKLSTYQRYKQGLEHFKAFAGSDASVREALTTDVVQEFKAHRLDNGAARETVNNDIGAVSILATYCLRKDLIPERPDVKRFKSVDRIRYLESEQIRLYMASVRGKHRTLFELLIGTGLRLGEAEALRACDLRLRESEGKAFIDDAKTPSGHRAVFLPEWVVQSLRTHITTRDLSGEDRLFVIPRRTVQKEHLRACGAAGIHDYRVHDHRHTAAVHLARAGMPLHLLQRQLGHARIDMTMRYTQFHPDYGDVGVFFNRVAQGLGLQGDSGSKLPQNSPHPDG